LKFPGRTTSEIDPPIISALPIVEGLERLGNLNHARVTGRKRFADWEIAGIHIHAHWLSGFNFDHRGGSVALWYVVTGLITFVIVVFVRMMLEDFT
jgi:hypothetical protein